jgi:PAS domain S-box-containing protein
MEEVKEPESAAAEWDRLLRRRAQEQLRRLPAVGEIQRLSPEEMLKLVHELQISQIELRLQNEELQRTQQELAKARDRYSDLYDFAPVGYVTLTPESRIVEANLTATRLLGKERKYLLGTPLSRFLAVDERDTLRRHLQHVMTGGVTCTCNVSVQRPDGKQQIVRLESVAVRDERGSATHSRTVLSDITAHKEAETALRASDARYRSLVENAEEGIFRSTPEGRFLDVNPALVRMLGYDSADEVLALSLAEDLYVDPAEHAQLRARYDPSGVLNGVELRWKKKDGTPIVVSLHARALLDDRGAVANYEGIVLDVTARKQTEQALAALSRRVLEIQEAERRALARELHDEMGQALMALRLNLRAAQRAPQSQSPRLEDSLNIVDQLVQQVRQLSLDLRPSLLDDLGLVAAMRWYVDRQSQRAGLPIHFSTEGLASRPAPLLETTCFRLAQEALTNVLRHARARHVWVNVQQRNNELHLRVRDDGVGFDVPTVRERASRGESLGILSMDERVRLVGGKLKITSVPAQGTEIHARFPLAPPTRISVSGRPA